MTKKQEHKPKTKRQKTLLTMLVSAVALLLLVVVGYAYAGRQGSAALSTPLPSGDTVRVRIEGSVKAPGVYAVVEGMSVRQAVDYYAQGLLEGVTLKEDVASSLVYDGMALLIP